jgi:hypothetical protein
VRKHKVHSKKMRKKQTERVCFKIEREEIVEVRMTVLY